MAKLNMDRVTVTMPGYIADAVADRLEEFNADRGFQALAFMLRFGGRDAEVTVTRKAEE